jgi:hypothetical protein
VNWGENIQSVALLKGDPQATSQIVIDELEIAGSMAMGRRVFLKTRAIFVTSAIMATISTLSKENPLANDWRLALEQSTELSIKRGSHAAVAGAVRRGADLRLYMTTETYEETLYFQQTYVGPQGRFAGLMSHHHSYTHRGQIADQPYLSFFKYDTSGTFSHIKWMLNGEVLDESDTYPYGIYRWFVCDRWRLVYEHDENGNRLFGDLEELKAHVRQGRTLQVGIRQLFGLAEPATPAPEHISFLTTMQPVIQQGHILSNCDLVLIGPARWPFTWEEGLHVSFLQPSTSGEVICYLAEPGKLPFRRIVPRRGMQWFVAEKA